MINCYLLKGMAYSAAAPLFHQWRHEGQVYGLSFPTQDKADEFALAVEEVFKKLGGTRGKNWNLRIHRTLWTDHLDNDFM